ncbi:beta/gamma crystallin domain-containing protein [Streptomyces sp. NRRL B-3648]|uniref:beta/gamma crystallin domain-containing protein n=1 Tax=Streptomyces sp. NRRL B-3648 TaxID=1519493 RepID=UPI0006AE159E|nr:beta/gamma crystallin domain-containing protein [Streptomyces sp. NRRL B-3648]KOV90533.1 antifungal protein [Streptomyces sp. NRRL B-3648]
MKLSVRHSLGVASVVAAALAATIAPAAAATASPTTAATVGPAINRTDCNENGYLEIHNNEGRDTLCFANAGSIPVAIYGVNWVESGNNVVTLQFQRNLSDPRLETVTLQKWSSWNPGHVHEILSIRIY